MRKIEFRNLSAVVRVGLPLCALLLISGLIFLVIQTEVQQNTPSFAQNGTNQQRNVHVINHVKQLQKLNNSTNSAYLHKQESPLSVVESMRSGDNSTLTSGTLGKTGIEKTNASNTASKIGKNGNSYFTFSKNKRELSTPENNSHTGEFGAGIRIALVNPTFTTAAYNHAFYVFYKKYGETPSKVNITSDLKLLSSKVVNTNINLSSPAARSAFAMLNLLSNLKWLTQDSNITVLTDADVDEGSIFKNNGETPRSNAFDVVILGHQEYVTQQEYDNLKQFVSNGGTMIILDGNVFFAQVKYDRNTQNVTLMKGHGWTFNGKSAWKSVNERWKSETSQWVGSNYLCYKCVSRFVNDPFGYKPHEEQYVTNPKDIVLLNYNASVPETLFHTKPVIASYELNYKNGRVISLGIYSDDIISNGKFQRYLDSLLLQYDIKITD